MATEKWVAGAGVGFTWTTAVGAEFTGTALASGSAVASSVVIANQTALDVFADLSISLASITPTGTPYIGVYLYPLNQDGSTYGDGRFGSAAAAVPPSNYAVGNIIVNPAVGVQTGALVGIVIPPGSFKFVFFNGLNVSTAAAGNVCKYRTYNISVA